MRLLAENLSFCRSAFCAVMHFTAGVLLEFVMVGCKVYVPLTADLVCSMSNIKGKKY